MIDTHRHAARVASSVLIGGLAVATLLAPGAPADPTSPLTELVDAAAQRLAIAEPVAAFQMEFTPSH